ncbi:MAG: cytochrome c3 family protein [Candidatus Methylomirabilales bacterium]
MRLGRLMIGFALVLGFTIVMAAFVPEAAALKVPPDFSFAQGKGSPGPVTFSHAFHKEKLGKCSACHTKVFKMKRGKSGTPTMAAMKEGKFCGACHNGKVAFSVKEFKNCKRCHKKK